MQKNKGIESNYYYFGWLKYIIFQYSHFQKPHFPSYAITFTLLIIILVKLLQLSMKASQIESLDMERVIDRRGENIFFIETNELLTEFPARCLCAFESAAVHNPNKKVYDCRNKIETLIETIKCNCCRSNQSWLMFLKISQLLHFIRSL